MSLLPRSAEPIVHHLAIYRNIWHMSLVSIFVVTNVATKIFWQELNLSLTRETEEHQACSSPQSCCSIQRYQNQDIHSVNYTIRVTTNSQGSTKSLMYMNADKRKPDTFWSQRDTGQTWERERQNPCLDREMKREIHWLHAWPFGFLALASSKFCLRQLTYKEPGPTWTWKKSKNVV